MAFYQQVNMVRFATELNEPTAPLGAALRKQLAQSVQHLPGQALVPVFNCQNHVIVQAVCRMIRGLKSSFHGA